MRPVGPSNKAGQAASAQGGPAAHHLSSKGSGGQPPVSPSAGTVPNDQPLARGGSSNDVASSSDGQYGLGYGMTQSQPQQGYSTPLVSKVSLVLAGE